VNVVVEAAWELPEYRQPDATEVERRMAEHALRYIADGATLQTGIGVLPAIVAQMLAEGPGGDYGIHSELFTPGLMRLHDAGKVTNRKGQFTASRSSRSRTARASYPVARPPGDVRFLPVSVVNDRPSSRGTAAWSRSTPRSPST
jgi:acyl-CoA hydrolase